MALPSTVAGAHEFNLRRLSSDLGLDRRVDDWVKDDLQTQAMAAIPNGVQRWHEVFVLAAPSFAQASTWLPLLRLQGKAHRVVLLVKKPVAPGHIGPRTIPQLAAGLAINSGAAPHGYQSIVVTAGKWVDVHRAIAAALLAVCPGRFVSALGGIRVGITEPSLVDWAAGDSLARFLTPELMAPDPTDIFPSDVVVSGVQLQFSGLRQPSGTVVPGSGKDDRSGWSYALPPIDTRWISPRGFLPYPQKEKAALSRSMGSSLLLTDLESGCVTARIEPGEVLGEHMVASMRSYEYVEIAPELDLGSITGARLIAGLATAGVPLLFPENAPPIPSLGSDLCKLTRAFSANDALLTRESKSIDMRREALRLFAPAARWARWGAGMGLTTKAEPTVSVVLATRREDKVMQAVRQINAQSWPNVEVVLVLHGITLSQESESLLRSECPRPVQILEVPAEKVLGEVLNAGVSAANGEYIAKMDDDDWYGPNHLLDLMQAHAYSGAQLVGSQVEFVYLEDLDIITRRPPEGERYSDHVAGGTMIISKNDLLELGGWRPVHRAVDRCLLQAVEAAGGSVYRNHGQNYVMHRYSDITGHGGHTWTPESETFIQTSKEQWDGFTLPPQINAELVTYRSVGRSDELRSVLSTFPETATYWEGHPHQGTQHAS